MLLLLVFATADSSRGDCDQGDETCAWDQADQPATAAQSSPAKPADDQCERWADAGECKANAAYMEVECAKACRRQARGKPPPPPPPETPDVDAHCGLWASKGECEKNAEFMATNCRQACRRHADELKDKDPRCFEWAAQGECDRNLSTKARCRTACLQVLEDRLDAAGCADVVARGECGQAAGLVQCRSSCRAALQRRLSPDTEGNCWYWGTDGECANNSVWMRKTCPRTCVKLEACSASTETASADEGPHSSLCSEPFECPVWPTTSERTARSVRGAASVAPPRVGAPHPSRSRACSRATCSTQAPSRTPSRARRRCAAPGWTLRRSSRSDTGMAPRPATWAPRLPRC